jgi:hypothetical protein
MKDRFAFKVEVSKTVKQNKNYRCRARLPGKAAGQGCRARLPGKAAGQCYRTVIAFQLPRKCIY